MDHVRACSWDSFWRERHATVSGAPRLISNEESLAILGCLERDGRDSSMTMNRPAPHAYRFDRDCAAHRTGLRSRFESKYRRVLSDNGLIDGDDLEAWGRKHQRALAEDALLDVDTIIASTLDRASEACVDLLLAMADQASAVLATVVSPTAGEASHSSKIHDMLIRASFAAESQSPPMPANRSLAELAVALRDDGVVSGECRGISISSVPEGEAEAIVGANAVAGWIAKGVPPESIAVVHPAWCRASVQLAELLEAEGVAVADHPPKSLARDASVSALLLLARVTAGGWERHELARLLRHSCLSARTFEAEAGESLARAAWVVGKLPIARGYEAILTGLDRLIDSSESRDDRAMRFVRLAAATRKMLVEMGGAVEGSGASTAWTSHCETMRALARWVDASDAHPMTSFLNALEAYGCAPALIGKPDEEWSWSAFVAESEALAARMECPRPSRSHDGVNFIALDQAAQTQHSHRVFIGLSQLEEAPARRSARASRSDSHEWAESGIAAMISALTCTDTEVAFVLPSCDERGELLERDELRRALEHAIPAADWANCFFTTARNSITDLGRFSVLRSVKLNNALWRCKQGEAGGIEVRAAQRDAIQGALFALRTQRHRGRGHAFGPFDGMLRGSKAIGRNRESIMRRVLTTSQIQSFVDCPFRFFQSHVLRLDSGSEPDELVEDHASLGGMIHRVLARFHEAALGEKSATTIELGDLLARLESALSSELSEHAGAASDAADGVLLYEAARARRLLKQFAHQTLAQQSEGNLATTTEVRAAFGPIAVGSGDDGDSEHPIAFGARADRIDLLEVDAEARPRLIDYKSGGPIRRADVANGKAVELPLLMLAAEARFGQHNMEGGIWSLKERGYHALFEPGGGRRHLNWSEFRTPFLTYLEQLLQSMRRSRFPVTPRDSQCEQRCEFRHVCRLKQVKRTGKVWADEPRLSLSDPEPNDP